MAVGYGAPEDVINAALRSAGYPRPIAEIYEGSRASRVAVEVYGPARDALLQSQDWDFAFRDAQLVATVGGSLRGGFLYEYNYPSDALRIRQVHGGSVATNDPQPVRFLVANDFTLNPPAKVIYTNQATAQAAYVGQITDPTTWNPGFTQAFVALLAKIFSFALQDSADLARTRSLLSEQAIMEGASVGDAGSAIIPEQALMMRAAQAGQRQ